MAARKRKYLENKNFKFTFPVKCLVLLFLLASILFDGKSQTDSSYKQIGKTLDLNTIILPISLICTGSALNYSSFRYYIRREIGNTTNIRLDNYIQYAPIGEIYICDLAGISGKNSIWDQTKYLAISEIFTSAIIQSVKLITKVKRPNGSSFSFPSGHTANAFTSATAVYLEFRDENMLLAVSGYSFSTATGILRITNNRHWISDVLAGAGIGILVTRLVYYWEPLKNWNPFSRKKTSNITPELRFSDGFASIGCRLKF